jgi:predicted DCC family thiol-disulfide oxidoreductase YuxK
LNNGGGWVRSHAVKQAAAGVALHPAKPTMVYDGNCSFCNFWIARWRRVTKERVDYRPSQDPEVRHQFPEIPPQWYEDSVQLIETDGRVYGGAEAVFRSLTQTRFGWLWWYRNVPGMAVFTEWVYGFAARHREGLWRLTKVIWRRG